MARQIFRKTALDRLSTPDQLDQLMEVTSPRGWVALAAFALLLLVALLWGLFGTVSTTVEAQGVLLREGGARPVNAPEEGVVQQFLVRSGDEVREGQPLVRLAPAKPGALGPKVVSPFRARFLQRRAKEGEPVKAGAPLLLLERLDEPLLVRLYPPIAEGYQVQPDMSAHVWPANVKKEEFGYLVGRVVSAAKFPMAQAELLDRVQNEDLVRQLTAAGPILQVLVELTPDPEAESGYRWSSGKGPPLPLFSGTPCQGQIVVRRQRPVQLIFPTLGGR
jgi:hypothetical protein